jgi:hypothetical protein
MNEQGFSVASVLPAGGRGGRAGQVAPIFQLLGEGQLDIEAVDALSAVLEAEGLPRVSHQQLVRACQIAQRPRPLAAVAVSPDIGTRQHPLRRLIAALIYDLAPRAARVGVRGGGSSSRKLLFAADQYEVMIQGSPDARPSRHLLVGQVSWDGEPVPEATVLLDGVSHRAETDADDDGSFRFANLAAGNYQLDVWAGNDLIVCAPVVLAR